MVECFHTGSRLFPEDAPIAGWGNWGTYEGRKKVIRFTGKKYMYAG